jgi:hypothetical protein
MFRVLWFRRRKKKKLLLFGGDLRANPFQKEWNDGDQGTTSKDLIQVPIGPITRARAKKFKDILNGLIQELWAQINSLRP